MAQGIQIGTVTVSLIAVQINTLPSASVFSPFDVTGF
jgi:hypothetical protein